MDMINNQSLSRKFVYYYGPLNATAILANDSLNLVNAAA
jgi:hypothetical protein